jgi:hypothetical protein
MVPLKLRAALVAAAALSLASSPALPAARHALADRGCKPLAPLAVELTAREPSGGPQVTLDFDLRPVLTMQEVSWELELGDGLTLVQGPAAGEAAPARGERTTGSVRVALPADGRATRATLVVTGHFTGHDETGAPSDETVELRRSLSWGEPPVGPSFTGTDPATGESASFVAVPAASSLSGRKAGR